MKVKELIEHLKKIENQDAEVCFADLIPVRQVVEENTKVFLTDFDGYYDVDEAMHEQQERDFEQAMAYADNYADFI